MTDISAASRADDVRRALARLEGDLQAAGLDLADPRVRNLVVQALGAAGGDRRLSAKQKQALALRYRAEGKTYREIAATGLYKSPGAAHKAVTAALDDARLVLEDPERVRQLELERLDAMFEGVYAKAKAGDEKKIGAALAIMDRRRHLVGGLDVLREADAREGGPITVVLNIPRPEHVDAVPQARLGEVIEARALEAGDG